jgi:hypothetical protein
MSLDPGFIKARPALDAKEGIGVKPKSCVAQYLQGMHDVSHDDPMCTKSGVQPVEGRLPGFEDVEIDPPPLDPVHPSNNICGAPVGLFDVRIVKYYDLQWSGNVPLIF